MMEKAGKAGCDKEEEAASDSSRSSFVPTLLVCIRQRGGRCRARAGSCRKVKGVEGRNRVRFEPLKLPLDGCTLSDPCG
jgi:hypothetical protein